jgi:protein-tyrosine kinase
MSRVDEALSRSRGVVREAPFGRSTGRGPAAVDDGASSAAIAAYPKEAAAEATAAAPTAAAPPVSPRIEPASPVRAVAVAVAQRRFSDATDGKVVVQHETSPASIEQYRRLAANLHGLQVSAGLHTIMVSSAMPRDGKTLTTTNLALTLSESYKRRVLVIDADLRRPSLHEVFGLSNEAGLADGLRGSATSIPIVQVTPTLSVLTAGAPDRTPMAGLTSERMRGILADARAHFDWVLIDTPPIGLISDAQLLASLVDGVVLVVGAGSTNHAAVTHTVNEIGRERIIGIVLNRVQHAPASGGYYHDYYVRPNDATRDAR